MSSNGSNSSRKARLAKAYASTEWLPDEFVSLSYIFFHWKKSFPFQKNPQAKTFFQRNMTVDGLPSLLDRPFAVYLAYIKGVPELYLSRYNYDKIETRLFQYTGPIRGASVKNEHQANINDLWKPPHYIQKFSVQGTFDLQSLLNHLKEAVDVSAVKKNRSALQSMRKVWEISKIGEYNIRFLSLDVETWEQDHSILTEFGLSSVQLASNKPDRDYHFIASENQDYRNGRYVPDARYRFNFGESKTLPTPAIRNWLSQALEKNSQNVPVLLIMHGGTSDVEAIDSLGIDTQEFSTNPFEFQNSAQFPDSGVYVVDTQYLYSGWSGERKQTKLETCCNQLGIHTANLHNAGNDARFTMDLFIKMMTTPLKPLPSLGSSGVRMDDPYDIHSD